MLSTNPSTEHMPCLGSLGQPLRGDRGTTPSFTITLICSVEVREGSAQDNTVCVKVVNGHSLGSGHKRLTLELNVGREGRKLCGAERPLLGDVVIGQRSRLGEGRQVEGRQD